MCVRWSIRECRGAVQSAEAGAGPRLFSMQAMRSPSSAWATRSCHDSPLPSHSPLNPGESEILYPQQSATLIKHSLYTSHPKMQHADVYLRWLQSEKQLCYGYANKWAVLLFRWPQHSCARTHIHTRSSTHPCYHCKKNDEEKKIRAINHMLTAESVGLPSPDSSERKIAAALQAMLPLICLQSHEPSRNTRWMKREHLNASAEGLDGEGADSSKVSKWIPLRHLREEWGTFSAFFSWFHANFLPI